MSPRRRRASAATLFFALLSLTLAIALYWKVRAPSRRVAEERAPTALPTPIRPPRRAATAVATPVSRPTPVPAAEARIAVIIDDLGNDRAAVLRLAGWREPIAGAVLPKLPGSASAAEALARSGKDVLLHLPMEPRGPGARPGPGVILVSQSDDEIRATLASDLDSVPHAVGVNNHMGSAATADLRVMRVVAAELSRRGLYFVDSRTTDQTVAAGAAAEKRVPSASRRVFLDDIQTEPEIERSLDLLVARAKAEGEAIAIGHPHPATLAVLERELPRIGRRGVTLVRVSELVR